MSVRSIGRLSALLTSGHGSAFYESQWNRSRCHYWWWPEGVWYPRNRWGGTRYPEFYYREIASSSFIAAVLFLVCPPWWLNEIAKQGNGERWLASYHNYLLHPSRHNIISCSAIWAIRQLILFYFFVFPSLNHIFLCVSPRTIFSLLFLCRYRAEKTAGFSHITLTHKRRVIKPASSSPFSQDGGALTMVSLASSARTTYLNYFLRNSIYRKKSDSATKRGAETWGFREFLSIFGNLVK